MTFSVDDILSHCPDISGAVAERHLGRLPEDYRQRFTAEQAGRHIGLLATLNRQRPVVVAVEPHPVEPESPDADGHGSDGEAAAALDSHSYAPGGNGHELEAAGSTLVSQGASHGPSASQGQTKARAVCTVIAFDHPFEFSLITGVLAGSGFNIQAGDVYTLSPAEAQAQSGQGAAGSPGRGKLSRRRSHRPVERTDPHESSVILDQFIGTRVAPAEGQTFDQWAEQIQSTMTQALTLLHQRQDQSIEQAKRLVNERVTDRLATLAPDHDTGLMPVELHLQPLGHQRLRLSITAQDTPAFLYSLTTALSLQGMTIERVRIQTDDAGGPRTVTDEIDLVRTRPGGFDEPLLERLRVSALLTKQFTYFLDRSPDPYAALERFEELTEQILSSPTKEGTSGPEDEGEPDWVQWLNRPEAMRNLAKLLGTSDYLWEDFIRGRFQSLEPILTSEGPEGRYSDPPQTLPRRLEIALEGAVGLSQQRDRVNRFKDRETFRLDLDHILNPGIGFRQFSEELTFLAENLISIGTRLVYDDLLHSFGQPQTSEQGKGPAKRVPRWLKRWHKPKPEAPNDARPGSRQSALRELPAPSSPDLPYAIFGLGKLGGVALGYASDIELMFVHHASPTEPTSGGRRKSISGAEFFEQFAQQSSQFISTRREGIFEVDLRLRPYGKEGPIATNLELFREYYGSNGPAHPFEKLALVRLRWIAGNPALGYRIEKLRDRFVYDHAEDVLDLDALWDIWSRAKQEKLGVQAAAGALHAEQAPRRGPRSSAEPTRTINAKYSPGALVDLEGTVQLLQVMHASQAPQLRVPRLSQAMEALQRAGVLRPAEYAALRDAYDFLRQLINALRMLRGNAQDLFLPTPDSLELTHLARRMNYTARRPGSNDAAADLLLADFHNHTQAVQQFIQDHFDRPCPS